MKTIILLITLYFFGCNNNHANNAIAQNISKEDSLKNELIGTWGGDGKAPTWNIGIDSIYFYDRSTSYAYKIISPDLVIYLPQSKWALKNISVIKDTMF